MQPTLVQATEGADTSRLQLETRVQDGTLVVTFAESRLDAANSVFFRGDIEDFLRDGHERIVLDIGSIEFIDSSGLGALVSAYKAASGKAELVLCAPQKPVSMMFSLTRMDRIFTIADSTDAAFGT